jgi:hypothetical protein
MDLFKHLIEVCRMEQLPGDFWAEKKASCLTVDWILGQFASEKKTAEAA